MSDDQILLRKAILIDEAYHLVKEVALPRSQKWPPAIRYQGRVFTHYAYTMPDTILAKARAEDEATYREIKVYEVPSV